MDKLVCASLRTTKTDCGTCSWEKTCPVRNTLEAERNELKYLEENKKHEITALRDMIVERDEIKEKLKKANAVVLLTREQLDAAREEFIEEKRLKHKAQHLAEKHYKEIVALREAHGG